MQKVIAINLNGNAYQLEEDGYSALLGYLDRAEAQLKDNPDQAEIVADLEQAIAEKCNRFLGSHKTVVTRPEVEQIIKDMGPVDGGTSDSGTASAGAAGDTRDRPRSDAGAPKRLYQIREGAMISGVCNGLAAYFNVDVTIVRIIFVVLAVVTSGVWVAVYFVLMFVIPYANTSEERAAAQGVPFNAQELIDQAKKNYADFKDGKAWKWHWKRHAHQWKHQWRQGWLETIGPNVQQQAGYAAQVLAGLVWPLFGIVNAALFMLLAFALFSVGTTGAVMGWRLPEGIPLWAGMLILVALYQVVTSPLSFVRHASYYAYGRRHYGWFAVWGGLLWLGFTIFFVWLGYRYVPAFHDLLRNLPASWNDLRRQP